MSKKRRRTTSSSLDLPTKCILGCLLTIVVTVTVANVVFLSQTPSSKHDTGGAPPILVPTHSLQNAQFHKPRKHPPPQHDKLDINIDKVLPENNDKIVEIFRHAGVELTPQELQDLPTWKDIVDLVGPEPIVHGLDTCATFQQTVPAVERNLGAAGMFNTGTNLVTQLLKRNCKIPERVTKYGANASKEDHGIRWQVSWGKHTPAHFKWEHATDHAKTIDKNSILPVVTIRNPYNWLSSMCRNGYTAKWNHGPHKCPNLLQKRHAGIVERKSIPNPVNVTYAEQRTSSHQSLAHLWNDWNDEYIQATYPRLVVRFEDLIFYPQHMTKVICECAGGKLQGVDSSFHYVVNPAKTGPGHGKTSERTDMVQAWMKYGKPPQPQGGFTKEDYEAAKEFLNENIMKIFGYSHPPPIE